MKACNIILVTSRFFTKLLILRCAIYLEVFSRIFPPMYQFRYGHFHFGAFFPYEIPDYKNAIYNVMWLFIIVTHSRVIYLDLAFSLGNV